MAMSTMYVVCGLPGVGKSTVSRELVRRHDAHYHRTDKIRKEYFGPDPEYTREESEKTYFVMLARAVESLDHGHDVVVDATFSLQSGRDSAQKIANKLADDFVLIKVECPAYIAKQRIMEREDDESDATPKVHDSISEGWESIELEHYVLVNDQDIDNLMKQIDNLEKMIQ